MSLPDKIKRMPGTCCICIDTMQDNLAVGTICHEYTKEQIKFCDISGMMQIVEKHIDSIQFPEPTVIYRSFIKNQVAKTTEYSIKKKEQTIDDVCSHRGKWRTIIVSIEGRNNSTWQGEAYCVEMDRTIVFSSELELIRFISE